MINFIIQAFFPEFENSKWNVSIYIQIYIYVFSIYLVMISSFFHPLQCDFRVLSKITTISCLVFVKYWPIDMDS